MNKILLTGHKGFIGRNILKKLSENDINEVDYFDIEFYKNDNWGISLENKISKSDFVLHVGAISDTMLQDANKMMRFNFEYSKKIFDLSHKYGCKVIYSSSAANTGDNGLPSNIYGWSKYLAEQYGSALLDHLVALRYFNVYGPGEEDKGKMSSVAYQASNKELFKLFPKSPKRDFVFIDDIVSATVFPINNNVKKGVYEVGSATARTFEDVLNLMNVKYEYLDEKDIPKGYQFYTKASKDNFMPSWRPKYDLEKGIQSYLKFLR